jgi:hypothetical protein
MISVCIHYSLEGIFRQTLSLRVLSMNNHAPSRFRASLTYELKLKDKEDSQKVFKEMPCEIILPLSAFIVPVPKTVEELKQSLSDETLFCKTATFNFDLSKKKYSIMQFMHLIPRMLNVAPVKYIKSTGAYFGNTFDNIPLAIRFKGSLENKSAKIDITCPDQQICDSLIEEIKNFVDQD